MKNVSNAESEKRISDKQSESMKADDVRDALFRCYNASHGGEYEIPSNIDLGEELVQQGFAIRIKPRKMLQSE